MTATDVLTAKIKRGLALQYLADLEAFRTSDPARFGRMVDGRGQQICSPASWLHNLASICANPIVVGVFPDFPALVIERLAGIGLKLEQIAIMGKMGYNSRN